MKVEQILKFVWKEFIYGAHLPAFVALSISFSSAILLDITITWDFLLIVYLIFYSIYLYNRFKELKGDFLTNSDRVRYLSGHVEYIPFIIFCSILIIILILAHFANFWGFILGFLVLTSGLLYTNYFKKITKRLIGFKSFYVSFVCALLVIFLAFYYLFPLGLPVIFVFTFIFLRLLVNTIFFDIKDIESDKKNKLKTIPVFFGRKKTLLFLYVINIISFTPIILGVYKNFLPLFSLSLVVFYFYSLYYLRKIKSKKINIQNLSYVIADGEYLLWLFILLLAKFITL